MAVLNFFFVTDTATTEIYTLSLHDALPIWERLDDLVRLKYCAVAACVLATVIVTRVAWVITYGTTMRFLIARGICHPRRPTAVPTVEGGIVVSWCGMRGIVT